MTTPNLNQLAPISDFDNAYVLAQQAHEQGFRGSTFADLYVWLKTKLDVLGLSNTAGLPEEFPQDGDILAAADAGQWTILGPGTYHQPGYPSIEVAEGTVVFAQFDGTQFSVQREVEMPMAEGTDTLQDEEIPKGKAVKEYATPLDSTRVLPDGDEFLNIDRPDIQGKEFSLMFTDEDKKIIAEIFDTKLFVVSEYDRPDLGAVYIDFNGRILSNEISQDGVAPPVTNEVFEPVFFEPTDAPAFYLNTSPYDTYANYISAFDTAINFSKWSSAFPQYVTKMSIGKTTNDDIDIFCYEFKPKNPKVKIIVTSAIHGVEKFVAAFVLRFVEDLCKNWMNYETLKWFRANVHMVLVPVANPEGFNNLSRRILETPPFNASWTKSGDTVTLTFNEEDFPTNNPNVQASNYFNAHSDLAGKLWVSLIDSSDITSVPDSGYLIQSVVDGQTITFTTAEGGASSGTCKIYISADPNRSSDTPEKPWSISFPSTNMQAYNEPVAIPISNKGTRPYSTNETVAIRNLIELHSDAKAHIDYHNGSARYDTRRPFAKNDTSYIREYNEMHAQFTDLDMPIKVTPLTSNTLSSESASHGINSKSVEWGGFDKASSLNVQVTADDWKQGYRWLTNTLLNTVKKYK